ncbi:MAG TPA: ABC transporter ATP-binding protein [Mycobacteriales bacterium]
MAAIEVARLRKSYGSVQAVRDVSFDVGDGECVALLGPNGAGKTTTLEVLEGHLHRDGGEVSVLGVDPAHGSRRWREQVGIVLQGTAAEPYLTVRESLLRTARFYPRPRDVDEVIAQVGLGEKAGERVHRLSGGQQRRLDVGLGIVGGPRLLFLDEPTTGFDPSARRGAWDLVADLRRQGTTIVLTTHYMDEAQALADRIVVIAAGQVVAEGSPEALGGRDRAHALIRFRVAAGNEAALTAVSLPAPLERDAHGAFTLSTDQEVAALQTLTAWSMSTGCALEGLTVTRPSLEDTYLSLVRDTRTDREPASA